MSLNVISYNSSLPVWVATAAQNSNSSAYALFEEHSDGRLTQLEPTSSQLTVSEFSQGHENIIGNNSVVHSHLDGDVVILPRSSTKRMSRSISHTYPNSRIKEYYCEFISTPTTSSEASSHMINDTPGSFSTNRNHSLFERDWSFQTVIVHRFRFPDDYYGSFDERQFFNVKFPDMNLFDLKPNTNRTYYTSTKTAIATTRAENGTLLSTVNATITLERFGYLLTPDISDIRNYIHLPTAGAAVPPDNLLIKLGSKIGSLKVNNLANLAQLRRINEFLPPRLRKRAKVFKTAAEFLLWYKYSIKTTEIDLRTMMEYYLRGEGPDLNDKSKGYSHRVTISNVPEVGIVDTFTVYLGSYQQSIIDKFGLRLNLGNTWDLIPFSFVVDWFLKIGDMLESLDARDEWVQVPLICYVASRKTTRPYLFDDNLSSVIGIPRLKFYCREVSKTLPMTTVSPSLNLPQGNLLTALSLVIANKR